MSADDLNTTLRYMHVDAPWEDMRLFSGRLGFTAVDPNSNPIDLKQELSALASERHSCAHVAGHKVTSVWLRAVPSQILRYAVSFDCLASASASSIVAGHEFLEDDQRMKDERITIRIVRESAKDWAEFAPKAKRATANGPEPESLFTAASARCGEMEVRVRVSASNELENWATPAVD